MSTVPPRPPASAASTPMTPEEWARAKRLLLETLEIPTEKRPDFLDRQCAGKPRLQAHVQSLLEAESAAPAFMERPDEAMGLLAACRSPAAPSVAPAPGQMVGSCRLISLLGEGSSGLVYLAEQLRPRRQVAVKILRPGQSSAAALRRLEREAEIMACLRHPGVAQVVEAGVAAVGPYFVLEYVEGEPITHYARAQRLSIDDRLHLFLKVCDAAQHAHSMGVIHRDLKPANILVTKGGDPKILDFGVAGRWTRRAPRHAHRVAGAARRHAGVHEPGAGGGGHEQRGHEGRTSTRWGASSTSCSRAAPRWRPWASRCTRCWG